MFSEDHQYYPSQVNMFDTGQAARELEFPSPGLAYLLQHLCGVKADKRFQLADWRLRPLPPDMQHYARVDTHFLLYMHDRLKEILAQKSPQAIRKVLDASRDVCLRLYQKELHTDTSYIAFYQNSDRQYAP